MRLSETQSLNKKNNKEELRKPFPEPGADDLNLYVFYLTELIKYIFKGLITFFSW